MNGISLDIKYKSLTNCWYQKLLRNTLDLRVDVDIRLKLVLGPGDDFILNRGWQVNPEDGEPGYSNQ